MSIYHVDEGWVIASGGSWLPGVYESPQAARYAFRFPDGVLVELRDAALPGVITMEHLRAARKKIRALEASEAKPGEAIAEPEKEFPPQGKGG